jgi:hypothetical protein
VQDDKRVAALVAVICLALLVFCPIERQVRRALGDDHKMPGTYPGNQMVRPTGRKILYHLSGLRLRVGAATDPPTIVISRGIQLHLLDPSAWNQHIPAARNLNELPAKYGTSRRHSAIGGS